MAGGYDVLGKGGPGQIIPQVRIRQDAGSFRRGDLESGMAEPFYVHGTGIACGDPEYASFHHLNLMAET